MYQPSVWHTPSVQLSVSFSHVSLLFNFPRFLVVRVYYVYLRLSSSFLISSLLWLLLALSSLSDLPCSTLLIFFLFASVSCLLLLQIRTYWVAYDNTVSFKTKKILGEIIDISFCFLSLWQVMHIRQRPWQHILKWATLEIFYTSDRNDFISLSNCYGKREVSIFLNPEHFDIQGNKPSDIALHSRIPESSFYYEFFASADSNVSTVFQYYVRLCTMQN